MCGYTADPEDGIPCFLSLVVHKQPVSTFWNNSRKQTQLHRSVFVVVCIQSVTVRLLVCHRCYFHTVGLAAAFSSFDSLKFLVSASTVTSKMQWERQTSPPVPPPGELDETYDSGLLALLCENMTSSAKPEVHNILHCRRRRIEPRPWVTYMENLLKFGRVFFDEIREQTDIQTNIRAFHNTSHPTGLSDVMNCVLVP